MDLWNDYKSLLNYVFFSNDDVIQKNTKEQADFWTFLEKYEKFKNRKKSQPEPSKLSPEKNEFDFPSVYNKRYKINFAINTTELKHRYKEYVSRRYDRSKDCKLSTDDLMEFKQILLYYLDFLQKQKFNKLTKLKEDQRNLPIKQYEDEIVYAVKTNQVVLVAGDTGCGKSTQVPQYLLRGGFAKIACTQPRRIACISLAKRVSYETLNEYRSDIAYQVRFETSKSKATRILFLTEGLLLRQFQSDPDLSMYDVIVVDEVHERHINGDFLLGVLKCLLEKRKDLKLVLMSATINIDLFTNYFRSAPVIQVPGRLFPIELQYLPHFVEKSERSGKAERLDPSPYLRVMQLIDKKYPSSERGDLLIFMSGMNEIASVVETAKEYALRTKRWIVLPLHSTLSIEEQEKIFDFPPEGVRKCIVSTNIAETSVTIDGVRFIADSGKVKEMTYDAQVKMERLQEFWISQASAEQRKGRAGRTGPGVCFRLYSDDDYGAFDQYSTPEIHRVPLDSLVLQMAGLGLRDPTLFPFIEPPQKANLVNAVYFLKAQNALTRDGELTAIGNMLSKLPVDICIGKMLIMGCLFSIVDPVLVIAAALSVQSPMTRKFGVADDTEHRRKEYFSPHGDPFTLLNIYDEWILVKSDRSANSKKWCKRRGFEEQRFYEISKLRNQFEGILRDHKLLKSNQDSTSSSSSKRSIEDRLERKRLAKLKHKHKTTGRRKKKMLKMDNQYGDVDYSDQESDSDEDENPKIDINDVEFKMKHNLMKLEASSKKNRRFTIRDINLLKLIISSGLFPQVVLPDEANQYRKQTEQVYHSKDKQFLTLHPTSVYSLQHDFLDSLYDEKKLSNEATNKPSSSKKSEERGLLARELLVYVSLLETNKPYVVNAMKVQMLQTLFLLSNTIDTNSDFTKIVFNEWIELSFEGNDSSSEGKQSSKNASEELISNVVQLRKNWNDLLEQKLLLHECDDEKEEKSRRKRITELENEISFALAGFIDTKIDYNVRRLMSVEVKSMYVGHNPNTDSSNPPSSNKTPNTVKGGVFMTPYLTYGCLKDDLSSSVSAGEAEFLVQHYHCPKCGQHLICTVVERIQHDENCSVQANQEQSTSKNIETELEGEPEKPSNAKMFLCDICKEELFLTPIEILRHKKSHL